jgi:hypothetical protein
MAIPTLPTTCETLKMPYLHVAFPVQGTHLPANHGYLHYRAITCTVLAAVQHCSGSTPYGINGILTLPKRQYCHWDAVLNALQHQCKIQW